MANPSHGLIYMTDPIHGYICIVRPRSLFDSIRQDLVIFKSFRSHIYSTIRDQGHGSPQGDPPSQVAPMWLPVLNLCCCERRLLTAKIYSTVTHLAGLYLFLSMGIALRILRSLLQNPDIPLTHPYVTLCATQKYSPQATYAILVYVLTDGVPSL